MDAKIFGYILLSAFDAFFCLQAFQFVMGVDVPAFGVGEGVFVSRYMGLNWEKLIFAEEGMHFDQKLTVDPQNPNVLYLASVSSIFESKVSTQALEKKSVNFKNIQAVSGISEVFINPSDPKNQYIILNDKGQSKLLVSFNGGEDFNISYIAPSGDKVLSFDISRTNPSYIILGTKKGIVSLSSDYGTTWAQKADFKDGILKIYFSPHNLRHIWFLTQKGDVYASFNLFKTHEKLDEIVSKENLKEVKKEVSVGKFKDIKIDPNINGRVYLLNQDALLRLDGKGLRIVKLIFDSKGKNLVFAVSYQYPNLLYLGVDNVLQKSIDGGLTWEIISLPENGRVKEIEVNPQDAKQLFLVLQNITPSLNNPPKVFEVEILPKNPTKHTDCFAKYRFFDKDGDQESGTQIFWYKNGKVQEELIGSVVVPFSLTSKNDVWQYSVTPKDGKDFGKTVFSNKVKIR